MRVPLSVTMTDATRREIAILSRPSPGGNTLEHIYRFHDGMWARVCMNDGDQSEWFNIAQRLRRGCVLSPVLFNILPPAALGKVFVRLSEDAIIPRGTTYLDEETVRGTETPLERVRRAVW